jgi:hypothetical protein
MILDTYTGLLLLTVVIGAMTNILVISNLYIMRQESGVEGGRF